MSSLCTSDTTMEPQLLIPNRASSLEFTKKLSISSLRSPDTSSSSLRTIPNTSARNSVLDDDYSLDYSKAKDSPALTSPRLPERRLYTPETSQRATVGSSVVQDTMSYVQRWAGLTRTVGNWDGLRRDPELWVEDGDCYVHLYAQGASRRGPSFRVPYRALRQKKCGAMLDLCDAHLVSADGVYLQQLSACSNFSNNSKYQSNTVELFVPSPERASRQESFQWHLTTRNFFAFILGKPLVGFHMGRAFVDLQDRMRLFRTGQTNNHQDFLEYAECQGYRDLVEVTDYALASLFYAEHYKLRDVWVDAFAHCVGMNDSLICSPEYQLNSRLTKALVTRAHLEVDVHLGHVSVALGSFLEDDLSSTYLGLTAGTRSQLIRFRRFLHNFYTKKFGYWPPPRGASFPKALYRSMFYDFQNLYDYLVDSESSNDILLQKPASGGICVLQNVDNFDKRHGFIAQPHPLPLLPKDAPSGGRMELQNTFRQLTATSQYTKTNRVQNMSAALATATNTFNTDVTNSKIVRGYMRFEETCAEHVLSQREHKVSAGDARKVRWLLIYGVLQYLVSALRAPKEVRDPDTPDYPLCCFVNGKSSWNFESAVSTPTAIASPIYPLPIEDCHFDSVVNSPIEPDCQREDYFTSRASSRRASVDLSAPQKPVSPIHHSGIRSFGTMSLTGRNSRRNSLTANSRCYPDIMVHGHVNRPSDRKSRPSTTAIPHHEPAFRSRRSSIAVSPNDTTSQTSWLRPLTPPALHNKRALATGISRHAEVPAPPLHSHQFGLPNQHTTTEEGNRPLSRSESTSSTASQTWSDGASATSSKTSAGGASIEYKPSAAEHSGLLGGLMPVESTPISNTRTEASKKPAKPATVAQRTGFSFGFETETPMSSSLNNISSSTVVPDDYTIGIAFSAPPSPRMLAIVDPTLDFTPVAASPLDVEDTPRASQSIAINPVVSPPPTSTPTTATQKRRCSISTPTAPIRKPKDAPKSKNRFSAHSLLSSAMPPKASQPSKAPPLKTDKEQEAGMGKRIRTFIRAYPGF
ncbi:hypothetical protein P153DRAFT_335260 [Dothidotthia symphoricarpi CBS 119687]|uniref:DUF8004 domain-containing protein n=1 Tax=Dothidotthia symphoricarpi CBS 119687 TaxID=1392245 RepID=A0A6A6AN70_9PLEO|nr:uncharacterized protein P153DRAFT_335260 [Dothidotthia symphoricarpi CBS 119687]KAF2132384.1 hypothetical protein P153DRAFT_335260 [Dothidotthia symphoricarpi CBS 119687]